MGSDENLHLNEDMDDEDRRSSHSDDPEYDVNKETYLGKEEDQAHDELQRRLVEYEISAECAPPINDNVVSEFVCDSQGQSHMQSQVKTTGGGGRVKEPVKRKARGATKAFKKPGVPMVLEYDEFGQPAGQWRDKYSQHVGILTRKIPITLDWAEVPPGLLQTAWDDTMVSILNLLFYFGLQIM